MNESMHEYVIARLEQSKGRLPTIAAETGISVRTIEKIVRRIVKNPGVSYIERLNTYFRDQPAA
jgi:uncharacterized protein YerC